MDRHGANTFEDWVKASINTFRAFTFIENEIKRQHIQRSSLFAYQYRTMNMRATKGNVAARRWIMEHRDLDII